MLENFEVDGIESELNIQAEIGVEIPQDFEVDATNHHQISNIVLVTETLQTFEVAAIKARVECP